MDSSASPGDLFAYYNRGQEQDRLSRETGKLEAARTQELLRRYLPEPPATILDVGGGAGIYALWLARLGYSVHLVDYVPLHVEQALAASAQQPDHPLASVALGDARKLEFSDDFADAVLMLGPLYHLTEKADRVQALREARRVLKPSGPVCAATISRFAPLIDALRRGFLADPYFVALTERDLVDGQHRNPEGRPGYFATAYFHYPTQAQDEMVEAGLQHEATVAIEGPGVVTAGFDAVWDDPVQRERLLGFVRTVESDPTVLGVSSHIMTVGRK